MTDKRYEELMSGDDSFFLTQKELQESWHFCTDMDGLLANSNDKDGDCYCALNRHRIYDHL